MAGTLNYNISTLSNSTIPQIAKAKATLSDCKSTIASISIPSDFPEGGKIRATSGKIGSIISLLSSAESDVKSSVSGLNQAQVRNQQVVDGLFGSLLSTTGLGKLSDKKTTRNIKAKTNSKENVKSLLGIKVYHYGEKALNREFTGNLSGIGNLMGNSSTFNKTVESNLSKFKGFIAKLVDTYGQTVSTVTSPVSNGKIVVSHIKRYESTTARTSNSKKTLEPKVIVNQNYIDTKEIREKLHSINIKQLIEYGGQGFHDVKNGDGYTKVYVTEKGKVFPDLRQYTGSNGDGTYQPNSIAEYPYAGGNIHGKGCNVCSIVSIAYANGIEKETNKSDVIKKIANELNELLDGGIEVNREHVVEEMQRKGLNPVLIENTIENKEQVVEYFQQGKSMVVRVPGGSDFCDVGHMMVAPEMVGDDKVVILNPGKRDNMKGHSDVYDLDKILFDDGYVIVSDM